MADTLIIPDEFAVDTHWLVYYEAENRQKRIQRDTSVNPSAIITVNKLYSALQDQFDELNQMDDGTPMSAQTPTEYTIGIIDAGDKDPWFIDRTSVEYLKGGALKTASWTRATGTNVGVVRITVNNTSIVSGDIGLDISDGTSTGTLLDVKGTGASSTVWIRPDTYTSTDDFSAGGTLTCNAHTATYSAGTPPSGESLWANIYSIGTIERDTHLYVYQNAAKVVAYAAGSTYDWWKDGQIDILINVKEVSLESDEAVIQVFARQYSKTYDHFEVDLTSGGRNPIPLSTGVDLNNTTGYRTMDFDGGTGTWTVGNYIYFDNSGGYTWATTTKKAVIMSAATGATGTLTYYLIGNLTDFVNNDAITEYDPIAGSDGDANGDVNGSPADTGPATISGTSISHGGMSDGGTYDVDENGTPENYSIVIDCNNNSLADVYEWTKYLTRIGGTTTTNTDGIEGERYIGSDYKIVYTGGSGTISEGVEVTGGSSGAKGTVVENNTTDKIIILRNSRGSFTNGETVSESGHTATGTTFTSITPIKSAPYGTFAGGKWFAAPGVVLENVAGADNNNYQLTTDNGAVVVAPTKVTISVGNTRLGDKVAVFRLDGSGGSIDKARYSATVQSAAATTLIIDTGGGITADEPGKSAGGVLRLVDVSAFKEYRIRYASWSSSTFTLAHTSLTGHMTASTNTTTIVTNNASFASADVGDLVYNTTRTAASYITVVTDSDHVTISPAITSQVSTDTIDLNVLPVATATNDTVYVPLIDSYETTGTSGSPGSESAVVTYLADIPVRVRARNAGNILPYEADSTVTTSGMSNSIIRTADSIFT